MRFVQRTISAWRGRVFLSAWILYAGYYFCRKDLPTGDPSISHFAFILACFSAAYALGQLVGGGLADWLGAKNTALAGAVISIACTTVLAFCSRPGLGVLLQLGNGFGQGFGWPALLKLIGNWFHNRDRDRVLGWWSPSYILGGLIATSLTAWLVVRAGAGYPSAAYLVLSSILLIAALVFSRLTAGLPDRVPVRPLRAGGWRQVLRSRGIRLLAGIYFFLKMTRYTLLFWLPHYLVAGLGYSTYRAVHLASYFELCGFLGPVAVGFASQRWFENRRLAMATALLFLLAFVCLVHPLLADSGWFGLVISISLMGILIHGADLVISGTAVLAEAPMEIQGRAAGLVNAVGSVGQAVSPLLVTVFVSRLGWTELFNLFVFFALVSGAICAYGMSLQTPPTLPSNRSVLEPSDLPL